MMLSTPTGRAVLVESWKQRVRILGALVRRDLDQRYRGSVLGWLWPILVQLAQLLVFTYLFAAIFRVRTHVPGLSNDTLAYGLYLFTGLVGWNAFQIGVIGGATAIVGQANLVKRVVFPLALLPIVPVSSALVEASAGVAVLVVLTAFTAAATHPTLFYVPLIFAIQALFTVGIAYIFAGLTVYLRDIPQLLGPLMLFGFYLTPIVYPASSVPHSIAPIIMLNPLSTFVEADRDAILLGVSPSLKALGTAFVEAAVTAVLGWLFFRRLRIGFADLV